MKEEKKVWRILEEIGERFKELSPCSHSSAEDLLYKWASGENNLYIPPPLLPLFRDLKQISGEDIFGFIYEYFLEKGEEGNRKRSGSFFTSRYIASFITKRSLEYIINTYKNDKTTSLSPKESTPLKVLDPSCGWGIFIGEFCRNWHTMRSSLSFQDFPFSSASVTGVDIQENAIKTARDYILHSRHLHGGNVGETVGHEEIGWNLGKVMAESIEGRKEDWEISLSFMQGDFLTDDIFYPCQQEFDLIMGNPPYFSIGGGGKGKDKTQYHSFLKEHHFFRDYFRSQSDIFYYFIIKAISLLNPGGILSFIIPSYWLENRYSDLLKREILANCIIKDIIFFKPIKIFKSIRGNIINIDTLILILEKQKTINHFYSIKYDFNIYRSKTPIEGSPEEYISHILSSSGILSSPASSSPSSSAFPSSFLTSTVGSQILGEGKWFFSSSTTAEDLFKTMKIDFNNIFPLGGINIKEVKDYLWGFEEKSLKGNLMEKGGICNIGQGQESGLSEVFTLSMTKIQQLNLESHLLKPNIKNSDIYPFFIYNRDEFLLLIQDYDDINKYPQIKTYLSGHKERLESRQRVKRGVRKWYSISIPQNLDIFSSSVKILTPYRSSYNRFALDERGYFNDGGDVRGLVIKPQWLSSVSYPYLLGMLNSKLINYWYSAGGKSKGNMNEYFTHPLSRIPVKIPSLEEKERAESLVLELQRLCSINSKEEVIKTQEIKEIINKTNKLRAELDEVIFDIYKIPTSLRSSVPPLPEMKYPGFVV